jgi:4-amino-4-deoxy-L-arabinose transferase-like glycosyltransferase
MFDILLTCCVLLGMIGLVEAAKASAVKGWSCFALAIGLGLLAKGPVIFMHLLPTALLVFFWQPSRHNLRWFLYLLLSCLAGGAIAMSWALPAAAAGGEEYGSAILWHQTADRTVGTKIHARGFYWYLLFLPMLVFPWISWPRLWQNLRWTTISGDNGLRFSLIWLLSTLLIFSLLPSKQLHYLIPMLPAFALLCASLSSRENSSRSLPLELIPSGLMALIGLFLVFLPQVPGLSQLNWVQTLQPAWGFSVLAIALSMAAWTLHFREVSVITLSASTVTAVFVGLIFFFQYTGPQYDIRPAALKLKQLNQDQIATAFVGDYQGQLHFLGRLTQALPVINSQQVGDWTREHPTGLLISLEKTKPASADYVQAHREYWLIFRNAQQATAKWHR